MTLAVLLFTHALIKPIAVPEQVLRSKTVHKRTSANVQMRRNSYEQAMKIHAEFQDAAMSLPHHGKNLLLAEQQVHEMMTTAENLMVSSGNYDSTVRDRKAMQELELQQRFLDAARYFKSKNPADLTPTKGRDGVALWKRNLSQFGAWSRSPLNAPAESKTYFLNIKRQWKRYVATLPSDPTLRAHLIVTAADALRATYHSGEQ